MHVIVWEFLVGEEQVEAFVSAYGPDGEWARLFAQAEGYGGTRLLRSAGRFVTIDSWESAGCFASFLERFGEDYRRLDEALAGCRVSEKKLGEFVEG